MLESNRPNPEPHLLRPVPPVIRAAKWPPDDDDAGPPGGAIPRGGGGGGGSFNSGDGNFKKGAIGPIAIIVGLLVAGGLGAFLFLGAKGEAEKIPVEKAAQIKKQLLVLPTVEQIPKWREYASSNSAYLKQEALKRLAWHKDPEGVRLATAALTDIEQGVRAQAAVALAEYGSPAADSSRAPLLKALTEAKPESKPQITWALVVLGEKAAQKTIFEEYRAGHLSQVRRLDGALAFDPQVLVNLVGVDELANMAGDPSPAVRQLAASVLSRHAEAKYTDALIKLLGDEDPEISRQAAPGLGKIGDQRSRQPLLEKMKGADNDSRTKYLEAMRKADKGEYGPLGELIARAVTNNLYRFVVPAVAGPARLVPLASLVDPKKGITATALRAAAERGRLRAQKADNGTWLSSKNWVAEYQRNKHERVKGSTGKRSE